MVDVFNPLQTHLLVIMLLSLARTVPGRLTELIALALVLRGSTPSERPALLDSFARCLRCMSPSMSLRQRRYQSRSPRG